MVKKVKKNILGVITARGGSKGIPGKNIKQLGGKPLIAYTIQIALQSSLLSDIIVSTDDEQIAKIARRFGAHVPFLRPARLSGDTIAHVPVLQHAVKFMEREKNITYDVVVILQPTSPFRFVEDIDKVIQKLIKSNADSAVTLVEALNDEHPVKAKKIFNGYIEPYSVVEEEGARRQDLPRAYRRSGAAYSMRRDLIMNDGKLYGKKIVGHIVPKERSIDIDEPVDWVRADYMLKQLLKKGYKF